MKMVRKKVYYLSSWLYTTGILPFHLIQKIVLASRLAIKWATLIRLVLPGFKMALRMGEGWIMYFETFFSWVSVSGLMTTHSMYGWFCPMFCLRYSAACSLSDWAGTSRRINPRTALWLLETCSSRSRFDCLRCSWVRILLDFEALFALLRHKSTEPIRLPIYWVCPSVLAP